MGNVLEMAGILCYKSSKDLPTLETESEETVLISCQRRMYVAEMKLAC